MGQHLEQVWSREDLENHLIEEHDYPANAVFRATWAKLLSSHAFEHREDLTGD